MSNTVNLLNGLEFLYPKNKMISNLKRALHKFPDCETVMVDALSQGQLKSKFWLISNLPDGLGTVFVCAGWYGTLANLMFENIPYKFNKIRSFDIDSSCASIAETINRDWVIDGWQFKSSTLDILDMDYPTSYVTLRADTSETTLTENPDTIINTSCEHINNFEKWFNRLPAGKLIVLQSNNFSEIEDHVNYCETLKEFSLTAPMSNILYEGELPLQNYTRFMKIGYK